MSTDFEQFKREFYIEAREILEQVADTVLKLETDAANPELMNSAFRGIHTIKGSAGSFELNEVSGFTHHLEGLLNALRDGKVQMTPDMADAILAGIDHIGTMIDDCESGRSPGDNPDLVNRFQDLYQSSGSSCSTNPETVMSAGSPASSMKNRRLAFADEDHALPPDVRRELEKAFLDGLQIYRIHLKFTSELMENGYDPAVFLRNLKAACHIYHAVSSPDAVPPVESCEPLALYLTPVVYAAVDLTAEGIRELCFDAELVEVDSLTQAGSPASPDRMIPPEAMREFIDGSIEMLEAAEQAIIEYETGGSRTALNEIFRTVHTIKGDADFIGCRDLALFGHALESLLEKLRQGNLARSSKIMDILLKSIDYIRVSLKELDKGQPPPFLPPVYEHLKRYDEGGGDADRISCSGVSPDLPDDLHLVFAEQVRQHRSVLAQMLRPGVIDSAGLGIISRSLTGLFNASRVMGYDDLTALAQSARDEVARCSGSENQDSIRKAVDDLFAFLKRLDAGPRRLGEILVEEGKLAPEDLNTALARQKPLGQILLDEGKVSEDDIQSALRKQDMMEAARQLRTEEAGEPALRTMRVDERKIEQFTNLVGEMLIARNTYTYLISQLEHPEADPRETLKAFKDNLHLFSRLSNDIHHGVLSLRMIPIRGIFQKFGRVVRDISRKQKKLIDFMTDGEDIEIDKKVADMLSDPLIHMVRNACDHGIETPLERKKAGKPEKGTVLLRASREGSQIFIRIIDDGKGIDRERLFAKAQSMGFAATSPDDPALLTLVFMPGLSTAAEITDVSGRGVGMDVVKTAVESVGGTVSVTSEKGHGTEVVLSIPTAMGIDTVLFVEAGGRTYAIPISYIVETLKLPRNRFRRAGRQLVFYYRGEVLPAHALDILLYGDSTGNDGNEWFDNDTRQEIALVITRTPAGKQGLIIDRPNKNMEIAVKPPPDILRDLEMISGVSILGDGRVLLVLNPEKIQDMP